MNILITGANGFVARHLARELTSASHSLILLDHHFNLPSHDSTESFTGDLTTRNDLDEVIQKTKPDACVHLGGISFVPEGADNPDLMHSVNYDGTINLLDSLREHAPDCKTLIISTAQVYGYSVNNEPMTEDAGFAPASEYAKSKAEADKAALDYAKKHGMHIIVVRPNNHTGPGQSPKFVVASFASQIKAIARGEREPLISVGNLESIRDFLDVRDVIRAYRLLLEQGHPKEAYNVSSGKMVTIQSILDKLCELADVAPEIEIDKTKFRPTDSSPLLDTTKIETDTGWKPVFSLDKTLKDMLENL